LSDKNKFFFFRGVSLLHLILVVSILLILSYKSFIQFSPAWDYLAYHLPGTLRQMGNSNFKLCDKLELILIGWPNLAYKINALSIKLTGSLNAANSANAIAFIFVILALCLQWRTKFSLRWFLTIALSIPLFVIHITSGYVDLLNASFILLTFGSLLFLSREGFSYLSSSFMILGAMCTGFAKLQGWPVVALILLGGFFSKDKKIWGATILAYLFFAIWPLKNIYYYGNPTYPIKPPMMSEYFTNYKFPVEVFTPVEILKDYSNPMTLQFLWILFLQY